MTKETSSEMTFCYLGLIILFNPTPRQRFCFDGLIWAGTVAVTFSSLPSYHTACRAGAARLAGCKTSPRRAP